MIAEAKAQFIHRIAKGILEKESPRIHLHKVSEAGIESAKDWEGRHNFHLATLHYFTAYQNSGLNSSVRSEAFFGFVQQLINLGAFRQARDTLDRESSQPLFDLAKKPMILFKARVEEKRGWINDYELGYFQSRRDFSESGRLLKIISLEEWDDAIKKLYSTTRHFIGRAEYGLAVMGIRKEKNISDAIRHFQEALKLDEVIDDSNKDGKVALGHAWIARCYMRLGNMQMADGHILASGDFVKKQLEINPLNLGPLAHRQLLLGERELFGNLLEESLSHFSGAAKIRRESAPYPKGLADAYYGMFLVHLRMKHLVAPVYLWRAIKAHPYTFLRGIIGG